MVTEVERARVDQVKVQIDDLKKLERKLKSQKQIYKEQADKFRKQSYDTTPGPLFYGLCVSAAKFEGLEEGIAFARNQIKKLIKQYHFRQKEAAGTDIEREIPLIEGREPTYLVYPEGEK